VTKRFRLSKNQRLRLRNDIDQDALERLLDFVPQSARGELLAEFSAEPVHTSEEAKSKASRAGKRAPKRVAKATRQPNTNEFVNMQRDLYSMRFADTHLQKLLEEVFAPALKADPELALSYRRNRQHWELCRAPLLLVLTEGPIDSEIAALIKYRPRLKPQFVIALSRTEASATVLNAAIGEMLAKFTSGIEERNERAVVVAKPPEIRLEPRWGNRLSRAIERLLSAPLKRLDDFGLARTHQFRISPP
jgi:hypothetical protein